MAKCEITGKHQRVGNNVSHANNRTKRTFKPNVVKVRVTEADGTRRKAYVSTRALKSNAVTKAAPRRVLLALAEQQKG